MIRFHFIVFALLLFNFPGSYGQLDITVQTVFKNEPVILNKKQYVNASGDTLTIETFKFYLSNFSVRSNGKWKTLSSIYFLVDAENEGSKRFMLNYAVKEKPDSLSFFIGVDSLMSVSGALEGALDPALGMFWAWNTGYINARLEGKSSACKTLHHAFEFHVGGYLSPYNAIRKVCLKIDNSSSAVNLIADASKWFDGAKKIALGEFNTTLTPSTSAMIIADNYRNMFSVK